MLYHLKPSDRLTTKSINVSGNGQNAGTSIKDADGLPRNTGIVSVLANGPLLCDWTKLPKIKSPDTWHWNMRLTQKSSDLRKSWRKQIRLMQGGSATSRNGTEKRCLTAQGEEKNYYPYGVDNNTAAQFATTKSPQKLAFGRIPWHKEKDIIWR